MKGGGFLDVLWHNGAGGTRDPQSQANDEYIGTAPDSIVSQIRLYNTLAQNLENAQDAILECLRNQQGPS
jgi:hypothetical protein